MKFIKSFSVFCSSSFLFGGQMAFANDVTKPAPQVSTFEVSLKTYDNNCELVKSKREYVCVVTGIGRYPSKDCEWKGGDDFTKLQEVAVFENVEQSKSTNQYALNSITKLEADSLELCKELAQDKKLQFNVQGDFLVTRSHTPSWIEVSYRSEYKCIGGGLAGPICKDRMVRRETTHEAINSLSLESNGKYYGLAKIKDLILRNK